MFLKDRNKQHLVLMLLNVCCIWR